MAARMEELAARQPGYLGLESTRGSDGLGITVSYWESPDDAHRWGRHTDHRRAQQLGRAEWYLAFETRVATVAGDFVSPTGSQ